MCGLGISASLCVLASDETIQHALDKAEQWKDTLEELIECANETEQAHLIAIQLIILNKINILTHRLNPAGQRRELVAA